MILLQGILFYNTLFGVILEADHFSELLNHIKPNTLVVLDIDDTILVPAQTLGSDVWFTYQYKKYLAANPTFDPFDRALADWEAVRHLSQMKIVEGGTVEIIRELQNRNIPVMALTTQGLALATRTVVQLQALGVDLSLTAPSKEDHYFINKHGVLYRQGILFTSGTPKGTALTTLLNIIQYHPDHIVFLNDKLSHLRDMESGLKNVAFTGLRYSYSDARVNSFDPKIAEIQWEWSSFGHILSDDEAKAILYCEQK
jgi:hypothetical protein